MNDSSRSVNTIVTLFPDTYNPADDDELDKNLVDTTDSSGNYHFRHVTPGRYVVLARNHLTKMCFIARNIIVNEDSVTTAPEGILDGAGAIMADFSSETISPRGYVYIPGTDIFSLIKNDGSALLTEVPAGVVKSVIFVTGESIECNVLRNEIAVIAGETCIINQPLWKHSRRIALNTTATGAGVTGNVFDFPVLVRLHSGNFNFTETQPDGQDIKFTDNSGDLRFEIERWDVTAGFGDIWVKIDTVFGNDSNQSITMYWGNPAATAISDGTTVFDTAAGYVGVWHLSESQYETVNDATINRYNGTSPDTAWPLSGEGIMGKCRVFDGQKDFIIMPNTADSKLNFPQEGYYRKCMGFDRYNG
jgi:hypothetical protein